MEDYCLDVIAGKDNASVHSIRLNLPPFTLVGTATRAGDLSAPLRDRFGLVSSLHCCTTAELEKIITRTARVIDTKADPEAVHEIALRSRGTPRIANRLFQRIRDFAQELNDGVVSKEVIQDALKRLNVDETGLDTVDRKVLRGIFERFGGGPVGIEALASSIGEESTTLEDMYEPYLLQIGFLNRTPRGRCITSKGIDYLQSLDSDEDSLY